MKRHIAVTVAELHYQGIHAGYLQLPVYRLDGGYVRMLAIHEHVPASGPALRREFELADTEYIDKPLITGVCRYAVEEPSRGDVVAIRPPLDYLAPPTAPADLRDTVIQEQGVQLADAEEQLRALQLYQLLALGGWGLAVLVLALGA